MRNFLRAARLCINNRWTLAGAIACALLVAVLWGGNITAVYPVIEVLFRDKSLSEWVDGDIAACQQTIAATDEQIADLHRQSEEADTSAALGIQAEIESLKSKRSREAAALAARQRLQPWVHRYAPVQPYTTLLLLVAALLLGTALKSFFLMSNTILVERCVQRAMTCVRMQYFSRALELDMAKLGQTNTGEMTSQFAYDMNTLVSGLRAIFGKAIVEPLKMFACLALAGFFCWRLLVFSLLLAPLAGFVIRRLAGSIKRANRRAMEEMSRLVSQLSESLEAVQIVRAFTMEKYEKSRFGERLEDFYRKSMRIVFYNSLTKPVTELFGVGVICLALLTGGYLVLSHQTHLFGVRLADRPLSPEILIAFFALLAGAADPARKLSEIFNRIQPALPAADRIFGLIDRPRSIDDPPQPKEVAAPARRIAFANVSFRYGDGPLVLDNVELEIPHGQALAIVGPNGCGKSTLMNLLLRFYDPVNGSVKLDDVDIRDMRLADLRGRIGLVSQQTQLFDDSVMENIRYGALDASDDDVHAAARRAQAHRFITEELSDGYQTLVGPRGGKLSGGQRQRIALARAILRDPDILILDEATSQVDLESEQLVHQVLQDFIRGRTALMITHRLSTLTLADRILVMESGRVLDLGTHDELMGRCALYQRLHAIELRKSA